MKDVDVLRHRSGDGRGLLVVAPRLTAPSHLWMRRQLVRMADEVACVATDDTAAGSLLPGKMVVWLRRPSGWRSRILSRLPVGQPYGPNALASAVARRDVLSVLVHYATTAVRYRRVWEDTTKPVFVHCHGADVTWDLRSPDEPERRKRPDGYADLVRGLPLNVQFIANSLGTMKKLLDVGIDRNRITVKYMGVEVQNPPPARNYESKNLNILYLGRLVDCKGPDLTIAAFTKACSLGLEATLTIAGDGPLREKCESMAASSAYAARIKLIGAVDAEAGSRLRRDADVFMAHSCIGPVTRQEEAFGVAYVEAMADGLPVLSGSAGSLPEIIEHGKHGLLVEPGDIDSQAAMLLRLAAEPELRRSLGTRAWARAKQHFTIEREIEHLKSIVFARGL